MSARAFLLAAVVLITLQYNVRSINGYTLSLNSDSSNTTWTIINSNGSVSAPGRVPGGVYSDLMRARLLPAILRNFNDVMTRWVAKDNWTYTATFTLAQNQIQASNARLVLEGVDTVAELVMNGKTLGTTNNMFVRYTYQVGQHLQVGQNQLQIKFTSAIAASKARSLEYFTAPACVPDIYNGECHANQLRKMQASFSWDWGPAFPSMGVWKPVYIEFYNAAIIRSLTTQLIREGSFWNLAIFAYLESSNNAQSKIKGSLQARIELEGGQKVTVGDDIDVTTDDQGRAIARSSLKVPQDAVREWWPNGFGDQPLYDVKVEYIDANYPSERSQKQMKIGFRTIELIQEQATKAMGNSTGGKGLTFYFKVNGYPLFMKGSNWIPANVLPEFGSDKQNVDNLLESAKSVHMSMLRVWGGGVYESDYFYSKCDELGILVWQDFMFACSMYPADDDFINSVKVEVEQNVIRLQHHPSIAVWAGNNENEAALVGNWYGTRGKYDTYKAEYIKLYVDTIKPIVEALDSGRSYLVSSPSNGKQSEKEGYLAKNPYDPYYGDTHYYNYIADGWSMNIYPKTRFASEYGFQSLPSLSTMKTATENENDFAMDSNYSIHRQHSMGGNLFIKALIGKHLYLDEKDSEYFKKFILYSQISQAMTMKAESEFYRQSQEDWLTMGALYWQLNDVWQAPSWSSIEFGGKWKMLHYFAKSFFAPVLISPRHLASGDIDIYLINDRFVPINDADIIIETYNWNNTTPIKTETHKGCVEPLKSRKQPFSVMALDIKNPAEVFFKFRLNYKGKDFSPANYVFPVPLKDVVGLKQPQIMLNVSAVMLNKNHKYQYTIDVSTDTVVLFFWLETELLGQFDDNGLILTKPITTVSLITPNFLPLSTIKRSITYQYYIH